MDFIFAVAVGAVTGLLTGAGIGGGTILVLYLTAIVGTAQGAAQGVNLLYFLASAPAALFFHIKEKRVEVKLGLFAAAAGCGCALFGTWLSAVINDSMLGTGFGILCIIIGVREVFAK